MARNAKNCQDMHRKGQGKVMFMSRKSLAKEDHVHLSENLATPRIAQEIMKMKSRDDTGQAPQQLSTPLSDANQNPWIQDPFGKKHAYTGGLNCQSGFLRWSVSLHTLLVIVRPLCETQVTANSERA